MRLVYTGISEMFTDYCKKRLTMSDKEIIKQKFYTQEQVGKFKEEANELSDIKSLIKLGICLTIGFCILLVASYFLMDWYDRVNNFAFIVVDYIMFATIGLGAFIQSGFALLNYRDLSYLEKRHISLSSMKYISETSEALIDTAHGAAQLN